MAKQLFILFLAVLCLTVAFAKEKVSYPSGGLCATNYTNLKDHPRDSKTYNEFWTYQFHLEGNVRVILNYSRANLGRIKDPVCGADLSIIGFRGKNYTVAREYPKSNFRFTDNSQQLNVHRKIWYKGALPGTHQVHFATRKKGVSYLVDLHFSEILPGQTWGNGIFKLGREEVGIFIHIPRASVRGVIAVNADTLEVSGTAYMDHTFQTDMGTKLVHSGYRYQATKGPVNVGYLMSPTSDFEPRLIGFGVQGLKEGRLRLLRPGAIDVKSMNKVRGIKVPSEMDIRYREITLNLRRNRDLQTHSILSEFKGGKKWIAKKFMGGEVLYFRGEGLVGNQQKADYNFLQLKK
jgi:hypothetical protein